MTCRVGTTRTIPCCVYLPRPSLVLNLPSMPLGSALLPSVPYSSDRLVLVDTLWVRETGQEPESARVDAACTNEKDATSGIDIYGLSEKTDQRKRADVLFV